MVFSWDLKDAEESVDGDLKCISSGSLMLFDLCSKN